MSSPTADSDGLTNWKSRFSRLTVWGFLVAFLVLAVFVFSGMNRLRNLSRQISIGMPQAEVEELLGEPGLTLRVADGSGELLCWVDMFWQVDVRIDNDGRVVLCRCVPSNSWFRNMQSKLSSLF